MSPQNPTSGARRPLGAAKPASGWETYQKSLCDAHSGVYERLSEVCLLLARQDARRVSSTLQTAAENFGFVAEWADRLWPELEDAAMPLRSAPTDSSIGGAFHAGSPVESALTDSDQRWARQGLDLLADIPVQVGPLLTDIAQSGDEHDVEQSARVVEHWADRAADVVSKVFPTAQAPALPHCVVCECEVRGKLRNGMCNACRMAWRRFCGEILASGSDPVHFDQWIPHRRAWLTERDRRDRARA